MAIRADRVGVRQDQVDIHGRVTSPSFLNDLLESLPEWTDMPVWVNGTEELLPSNNSVPVTSPILADIAYPDIRRDNQYFTYRESPTPVDGLAKIKSIKGNTLVWNQNCYSFFGLRSTLSSAINSQTDITCTASSGQTSFGIIIQNDTGYFNFIGGHKYLLSMNISEITVNNFSRISPESALNPQTVAWETGKYITICNPTVSGARSILCYLSGTTTTSDKFKFNSVQIIDLTMLNDSRITDYDSFRTYYPLGYYSYNQGSLLSFNGTGIKTVGKNLLNSTLNTITVSGVTCTKNDDGSFTFNGTATTDGYFRLVDEYQFNAPSSVYISVVSSNNGLFANFGIDKYDSSIADSSLASLGRDLLNNHPSNIRRVWVHTRSGATYDNVKIYPMIRFATVSDDTFEPYTESVLSLPISTYFPTGMKSAGSVYDELTPTKAITRIGVVDLGTLTFSDNGAVTGGRQFITTIPNKAYSQLNITSAKFIVSTSTSDLWTMRGRNNSSSVAFNVPYATAEEMQSAMSGVYLYYELATPVELPTMSFE